MDIYRKRHRNNPTESAKFFKIVVNPQHHSLRIPAAFIGKCGQNLPDKVTLKAPSGSVRQIELVQDNVGTWFHKGWKEFRDFYSIDFGHVLVFEFDGKSHFDVFIFDMTAVEIEYPLENASDEFESETEDYESDEDEDSAVILKQSRTSLKGKEKCKKMKGSEKRMRTIVNKETCIAYQRAKAFKTIHPFYLSLMQPTYVSPPFIFGIPKTFARVHLFQKHSKLSLRVRKGETWTVMCNLFKGKANLSSGWKKFVKDNALKVGDACVFEVNESEILLWDVTIFRN